MSCEACGHENPPANRFCGACGALLARPCPLCAHANPPDHRFCGGCGSALAIPPARRTDKVEARKVVTILFADLIGSTALHERLDPESVSRVMERYHKAVRTPVEAHAGTVVQLLGDGVMCAFGVPRVAEDDAIRAVRAAVGVQQAFREFAREHADVLGNVGLRVAVNTGEVVVSDDYAAGIGDPLNVAARLQQEAHDGEVLIGEATERLVRERITLEPVGTFNLKGRAETVTAYRVVSLERPAGASATAFVGRDDELRRITAVYDAAVAARRARLAVILGSPGLGKSRLMAEFARRLGYAATAMVAHCDATGGATFAPLAEALRTLLGADDRSSGDELRAVIDTVLPGDDQERGRIAAGVAALLSGTPSSPEETFFVVRRFLAAFAAGQPVVLAVDDLQWAEPLLLDLVEHLVQWSTDVPLLLLVAARPELRDTRSSLATQGGLVSEVVTLAGLDAAAATHLAANVIGADALPAAVAGRVLATSEGNPLFVGELVRMLVHDGALKREGDRWTTGVELARVEMPPTIQALLAARIERLRPEECIVLERAAVVGRQFSRTAVTQLLPREITDLDARLEALRRSELIEPDTGWFLGEPVLRFHHILIRDAAYRRLLKNTRAELHSRFADWFESQVGDSVEHEETVGWHLEQAHQHLRELGPLDASGRALGERAARYLAAAGRRALARDDLLPAANLLGRALDRLDADDSARAELALDWCEALLAAGDVGPAAKAIDELGRFVEDKGLGGYGVRGLGVTGEQDPTPNPLTPNPLRLRAWHTCFAGQLAVLTDPQSLRATADAVAAAAEVLAAAGDDAGEAKAHWVHALALSRLGKIGASEAVLDRALAAARRGNDRRRSNGVLAGAPLAALWGPSPVTRASGRCLDVVRVLRITQGAPAVEAVALRCQGVLEALRGRTEAARRMITSARRMVEELGLTQGLLETEMSAGLVELIEGNDAAAERSLRTAYEGFRDHGLGIDAARAAALLGRSLLFQGRAAEAEALSHESEALAGDDLQAAITWRRVRAEALARRGEHVSAVELARAAVEIAAATDALLHHADARLALTAALRAAGRSDEADAEEARAIELWEAKGATLPAERARRGAPAPAQVEPARDEAAPSARSFRRRLQPNAATAAAAHINAAFAARDADALARINADWVDHTTHLAADRRDLLRTWRSLLKADDLTFHLEPLATLGGSLALCLWSVSASGIAGGEFDVGSYEHESFLLIEVDAQGGPRRGEIFAPEKLGDAIARLYERYAEILPEGPERERAAATACSVAAVLAQQFDLDRAARAWAPTVELIDHRLVGFGSVHGLEATRAALGTLVELADDLTMRIDDVLGLRSDALLLRWTNLGTLRAGGGAFERHFLYLGAFGAEGLVSRWEIFDADRDADALARFDELAVEPPRVRRRVRPNAATAIAARMVAAFDERDADALTALCGEGWEIIHHPTGTSWEREGFVTSSRAFFAAQAGTFRAEPLATLGDALALCRVSWSASGIGGRKFDVGAYEIEEIGLIEADEGGQYHRGENFAAGRLGDAVARLYERYADLLPDGPERARAAATAPSVATLQGPWDRARGATPFAPDIEVVDHRRLGTWSARGGDAFHEHLRAMVDVADNVASRFDDVLDLRADAFLMRVTHSGTARAGGGAYERQFLLIHVFATDGRLARLEYFDVDREDEALARFDELTLSPSKGLGPEPSRRAEGLTSGVQHLAAHPEEPPPLRRRRLEGRVRPNAATAISARLDATIAARDAAALPDLVSDHYDVVDHLTGTAGDREGMLLSFGALFAAREAECRHEPLATLGRELALLRESTRASDFSVVELDVGEFEIEKITVLEADDQGRARRAETFPLKRLGDAVVRLYERYAELLPEGPERHRAAATVRSVAAWTGPVNLERHAAAAAPDVEFVDRRTIGVGSARGVDELIQVLASLVAAAPDATNRFDDVLSLRPDAWLLRMTNFGTDRTTGGAYERQFLALGVVGPDGRTTHIEQFDTDRADEALARFDELVLGACFEREGEPPGEPSAERTGSAGASPSHVALASRGTNINRRVRPNAATANGARIDAAIAARDVDALSTLFNEGDEVVDHTTGITFGRDGVLAGFRLLMSAREPAYRQEPLATLGDNLVLYRQSWSISGVDPADDILGAAGAATHEDIVLNEVDADGQRRRAEIFALDHLGDAVVRLYERYSELLPVGVERKRAAAIARSLAATLGALDLERYGTALAADIEFIDHRILGFGMTQGAEALLDAIRTLFETADRNAVRVDAVLGLHPSVLLLRQTTYGTLRSSGGDYEIPRLVLRVFDGEGLLARLEFFEPEYETNALARFDELTAESPAIAPRAPRFENAATRVGDRLREAMEAHDWERFAALFAAGFRSIDRQRMAQLEADRDRYLYAWQPIFETFSSSTLTTDVLATRGERLLLTRVRWTGSGHSVGPSEFEWLEIFEVDDNGQIVAEVTFDPDDFDAAYAELDERYVAGEAAPFAAVTTGARAFAAAVAARDWEALAAVLAPDLVIYDHRPLGWETLRGPAMLVDTWKSLVELAPDVRARIDHVTVCANGSLAVLSLLGSHDGGEFEDVRVVVHEYDGNEKIRRHDIYTVEQLAEARARYEALGANVSRDPPSAGLRRKGPLAALAKPNAATAARDRVEAAYEAQDWKGMRAVCAVDAKIEDRRRYVLLSIDVDGWIAERQRWARAGAHQERHLVGSAADRVALERVLVTGGPAGGSSEFEYLSLTEVDESGRIVAGVVFDLDDWRAAYREAWTRWLAADAAAAPVMGPIFEYIEAFNDHDAARVRAVLADDVVVEDRRLAGGGRIEGANRDVENMRVLWNLAPDIQFAGHVLACEPHGFVGAGRTFGTLADGGGAFENYIVAVYTVERGRVTRYELFEIENVDAALARFAELRK